MNNALEKLVKYLMFYFVKASYNCEPTWHIQADQWTCEWTIQKMSIYFLNIKIAIRIESFFEIVLDTNH